MTKIIELRPNKCLLNPNFEKYQFCSESIPVEVEKKLENEVIHLELSTSQQSWLEARLFALHNHLFTNPFDTSCWFVDNIGAVWRFINGELEHMHTLKSTNGKQIGPKYNSSIGFASKTITVMSNGSTNLEFLIKEDSQKLSFIFEDIDSGNIMDVQHLENNSIIVSIYSVVEIEGKIFSRLTLLTYSYKKDENPSLILFRKQILKFKGTVEYIYIENNGKYFHAATQDPVIFEYDSLNPIKEIKEITENTQGIKIPKYCWSQDEDTLTVWLNIPDKCINFPAKVDVKPTKLAVSMKDVILIQGDTQHKLEPNLATWQIKDNKLEIEFTKSESGLMWNELLKGDSGGEFLPNQALAEELHSRLAHLCSDQPEKTEQPALGFNVEQLEECDLEGRENVLQRVHLTTHNTSNLSMLSSSNSVLFTQKIPTGQMFCCRHDHDGCVWVTKQADNEHWELEHVWTFPGFGYVEASKSNKKFCISPPDGSFIAIIEHTRRAFVYQRPENNATVAKQRIIDFGSNTSPILGAAGIKEYLIILTKDRLYRFRV